MVYLTRKKQVPGRHVRCGFEVVYICTIHSPFDSNYGTASSFKTELFISVLVDALLQVQYIPPSIV